MGGPALYAEPIKVDETTKNNKITLELKVDYCTWCYDGVAIPMVAAFKT